MASEMATPVTMTLRRFSFNPSIVIPSKSQKEKCARIATQMKTHQILPNTTLFNLCMNASEQKHTNNRNRKTTDIPCD